MLSYAGVDLVEATEEVDAWVRAKIDPAYSGRFLRRQTGYNHLDYAAPWGGAIAPPVSLGVLRWPAWGASRWAEGHYLVDGASLDLIRSSCYQTGSLLSAELVISDGVFDVTMDMLMLPPRPLADAGGAANGLWLLTLVDERFLWWFRSASVEVTQGTTTWNELLTLLATGLEIEATFPDIVDDYLKPPGGIHWTGRPLPVLMDAACASVGVRLCRRLDGTVIALSATDSLAQHELNLAGTERLAGGHLRIDSPGGSDLPALVPESVTVTFDRDDGSDPYLVEINHTDLDLTAYFGSAVGFSGTKRFRSTAVAGVDATPDNEAELSQLAQSIAADYFLHQLGRAEARYAGVTEWIMEGLTGTVEYEHRCGRVSTRVSRPAELDHADVLYHLSTDYPDRLVTFGSGSRILAGALDVEQRLDLGAEDGGSISTTQTALPPPDAPVLYVNATGDFDLKGIAAPDPLRRQFFTLYNSGSSGIITVKNNDSSASASDRIYTTGTSILVGSDNCISFLYDTAVSKWRASRTNPRLTVQELDGSPAYTDVTDIRFNQDHFTMTQPAAGAVRVDWSGLIVAGGDDSPHYTGITGFRFYVGDAYGMSMELLPGNEIVRLILLEASATVSGIVNTGSQSFGGTKGFQAVNTVGLGVSGTADFQGDVLINNIANNSGGIGDFGAIYMGGDAATAIVVSSDSGLGPEYFRFKIRNGIFTNEARYNGSSFYLYNPDGLQPAFGVTDWTSDPMEPSYGNTIYGGSGDVSGITVRGGLVISGSITSAGLTVGTSTISGGTSGGFLYNNGGVLGSTTVIEGGTW